MFSTYINYVIKIQKWFRGCIFRLKRLPLILYKIQKYLITQSIKLSNKNEDGRINSCLDEDIIINLLVKKFTTRIIKPKVRMWYDLLAFDYINGWIPINIKTTTTKTNDNIGNLTTLVYSYTNELLHLENSYKNGEMSDILYNKLKNKQYNKNNKKDYYFIVLNKNNSNDIIINSIKGLDVLTSNINNLPFQVCWSKNKIFNYGNINKKVQLFIDCFTNQKLSWKEKFLINMRTF